MNVFKESITLERFILKVIKNAFFQSKIRHKLSRYLLLFFITLVYQKIINVRFLVSDKGILQIFSISFNFFAKLSA